MTGPERRRRRPAVSCSLCRRRKIRCNRESPCSNCIRSGAKPCVYENFPPPPPPRKPSTPISSIETHLSQNSGTHTRTTAVDGSSSKNEDSTAPTQGSSVRASSMNASTPASRPSAWDVDSMRYRTDQHGNLVPVTQSVSQASYVALPGSTIETTSTRLTGTFHIRHENPPSGPVQIANRTIVHKNRLFGQSHWSNGVTLFRDIFEIIEPEIRKPTSKIYSQMQKCKHLSRIIKSQREPPWPTVPTTDLPTKDVADELVDCYLRTIEPIYRVLHIPTFMRDYEAVWGATGDADIAVFIQIKLVLAIGANTYDEQFSLRSSAIRWVYEAQTWLAQPEYKSRLTIQCLQISLLHLIARETSFVGRGMIWVPAGSLVRTAMFMGLHRDPVHLPKMTPYISEMRRRLWNTILEMNLQSAIEMGGVPLVLLNDFDTQPPGNFDDEQLMSDSPLPKSEDQFTQMSIAIALRKTFAARHAITHFLNALSSSHSYEDTLKLDGELRASYRTVRKELSRCLPNGSQSPVQYDIRVMDFLMHRYFCALHVPFFASGLKEASHAFSRKVVVESSLKIWYAVYPQVKNSYTAIPQDSNSTGRDDLARFSICGSGMFRLVAVQATYLIALELRAQLQEEESLGTVPLRPDLLSVIADSEEWLLKCLGAGETNTKGYMFLKMVAAYIDGLRKGLNVADHPSILTDAAEAAGEECLVKFEEQVKRGQDKQAPVLDEMQELPLDISFDFREDWGFLMSLDDFNFSDLAVQQ